MDDELERTNRDTGAGLADARRDSGLRVGRTVLARSASRRALRETKPIMTNTRQGQQPKQANAKANNLVFAGGAGSTGVAIRSAVAHVAGARCDCDGTSGTARIQLRARINTNKGLFQRDTDSWGDWHRRDKRTTGQASERWR